jgi:hypothetical protein
MEADSKMQDAEHEIRHLLERSPGEAMTGIVDAYNHRSGIDQEAFVAVLAARVAASVALSIAVGQRKFGWSGT